MEYGKFVWLNNDLSTESNEEGIAVFEALTPIGSTRDNFYIHFVCDGLATAFWGD